MPESQTPVVIVSSDTHIGPLFARQLRAYCPTGYTDAFDEFVTAHDAERAARAEHRHRVHHTPQSAHGRSPRADGAAPRHGPRRHRRRGDLPRQPELRAHPVPSPAARQRRVLRFDRDLAAVGLRIYNEWLADSCSVEPARHVGLAHLPMWDPVAATAELTRVADMGLRGVNFPALRHGVYLEYNDRAWDPFWAECEELDTHAVHARRRREPGGTRSRGRSPSRSRRSKTVATSPAARSGG